MLVMSPFACTSETASGSGTVAFNTWGEEFIEQEIPPKTAEGEEIIVDGWTVKFDKFLVNLAAVKVADASGAVAGELRGAKIVDHTKAGKKALGTLANLPAKAWNRVSFEIVPATAASELAGASAEDKAKLIAGGFSIYVEGKLSKAGSPEKKFAWGFTTATSYASCVSVKEDGKVDVEGVVVKNGVTEDVELTIHGDHFFYDDLQSDKAKVRGENIAAADANNDGTVTLEELAQVKLATIPAERGRYGTGSASGINDLRAFVTSLSQTLGHFRGEGECQASSKR
jgi:hypothetical protein